MKQRYDKKEQGLIEQFLSSENRLNDMENQKNVFEAQVEVLNRQLKSFLDDISKMNSVNNALLDDIHELQNDNEVLVETHNRNSDQMKKDQNEKRVSILGNKVEQLESSNKLKSSEIDLLKKEIVILKKKIEQQEEMYLKDRIEGQQHLGLSKIDFLSGNLAHSKVDIGLYHGGRGLGEIGEEPDEDEEHAEQSMENLRLSQLAKPQLKFKNDDAYAMRSSVRLSKFGNRGKMNLGVVEGRDSGIMVDQGKVTMLVKWLQDSEQDTTIPFSFWKDYLNVSNNQKVINILHKYGDQNPEGFCMTDHIFVFNNKMERKRMRILITNRSIFLFKSGKDWKIVRRYSLDDLKQVVVSAKNFTLTALKFEKGYDLLVDSYRRIDIVLYLAQRMKKAGIPLFKIVYLRNFNIRKRPINEKKKDELKKETQKKLDISLAETGKTNVVILQETFRNAIHSGYLRIKEKKALKMFGSNNVEYFMILTNLGILFFKSFGNIKPQGFIPVLGSNIVKMSSKADSVSLKVTSVNDPKRMYRFTIEFPKMNFRLQASSQLDMDQWIDKIQSVIQKSVAGDQNYKQIKNAIYEV